MLLLDTPASELICQALVRLSWDCCRCNDHIVGLSPRKKCEKNQPAPLSSSLINNWVADGIFCSFQCGLWDIQTLTCIAHREIFNQKPTQFPYFPNPNGISAKSWVLPISYWGQESPQDFTCILSTSNTSTGH